VIAKGRPLKSVGARAPRSLWFQIYRLPHGSFVQEDMWIYIFPHARTAAAQICPLAWPTTDCCSSDGENGRSFRWMFLSTVMIRGTLTSHGGFHNS
jgi:hypothetical protein